MKNVFIYAHNAASNGAKELATALGVKRIKHRGSGFRPNADKLVVNWGSSEIGPDVIGNGTVVLNPPHRVSASTDKVQAFLVMSSGGARVPDFATTLDVALAWQIEGHDVCVRALTRASGGKGLSVVGPDEDMPRAPLYTKYVKKKDEYRVHICNDSVIGVQRKAARKDFAGETDWQIRSHDNGFVFLHIAPDEWGTVPADVLQQAATGFAALKLDFGAVDVIWNSHHKKAYVLEVNSAPGLEGTTIDLYKKGFTDLLGSRR